MPFYDNCNSLHTNGKPTKDYHAYRRKRAPCHGHTAFIINKELTGKERNPTYRSSQKSFADSGRSKGAGLISQPNAVVFGAMETMYQRGRYRRKACITKHCMARRIFHHRCKHVPKPALAAQKISAKRSAPQQKKSEYRLEGT